MKGWGAKSLLASEELQAIESPENNTFCNDFKDIQGPGDMSPPFRERLL